MRFVADVMNVLVSVVSSPQAKIKAYTSKYGTEPELWPVAKPLVNLEREMSVSHHDNRGRIQRPSPLSASDPGLEEQRQRPRSTTPTTPHMDLSWQVRHAPPSWSTYILYCMYMYSHYCLKDYHYNIISIL